MAFFSALREGHSYVVNLAFGDPKGFSFQAESGGRTAGIGEEIPLKGEAVLRVESPKGTDIKMVRDGDSIWYWIIDPPGITEKEGENESYDFQCGHDEPRHAQQS